MSPQRDQISHPIEKVPDERELTQDLVSKEPKKQYVKDCLSPRSILKEKKDEQTTRRIPVTVEDANPQKVQDAPILDSGAWANNPHKENSLRLDYDIQGSKKKQSYSQRVSIPIEDIIPQKFQVIPVIHITTKVEGLVNPMF
ncbi:hypothetical protein AMTRI_Chr04g187120 [Amborella trichopoda]